MLRSAEKIGKFDDAAVGLRRNGRMLPGHRTFGDYSRLIRRAERVIDCSTGMKSPFP
jgi:hypothetical protein